MGECRKSIGQQICIQNVCTAHFSDNKNAGRRTLISDNKNTGRHALQRQQECRPPHTSVQQKCRPPHTSETTRMQAHTSETTRMQAAAHFRDNKNAGAHLRDNKNAGRRTLPKQECRPSHTSETTRDGIHFLI
jgi:hypothetical protein